MMFQMHTNQLPSSRTPGFVVAMRARLVDDVSPFRREWVIVSRWGADGMYLSVGWTMMPAVPGEAPIHLRPRQTAVAVQRSDPFARAPVVFEFVAALPPGLTAAGDFIPAEGHVQLYGSRERLRVRSRGQCLRPELRAAWRFEANRAVWIGEFIEGPPQARSDPASGQAFPFDATGHVSEQDLLDPNALGSGPYGTTHGKPGCA